MSRNTVIAIVVILVVLIGGWLLTRPKTAPPIPSTPPVIESTASPAALPTATPSASVVNISSSGFSPQNTFIKAGESVTWTNADTANHTVNSAVHPTHSVYPPLNLGLIQSGESKSLTFPSAGTYKYHDHLNPSLVGSVTVQ